MTASTSLASSFGRGDLSVLERGSYACDTFDDCCKVPRVDVSDMSDPTCAKRVIVELLKERDQKSVKLDANTAPKTKKAMAAKGEISIVKPRNFLGIFSQGNQVQLDCLLLKASASPVLLGQSRFFLSMYYAQGFCREALSEKSIAHQTKRL